MLFRSINGVLQEILPPATRRLYWQADEALKLVRMDTRQVLVPVDVMNAVYSHVAAVR